MCTISQKTLLNGWKCHLRGSKFQNFPRDHAPGPSSIVPPKAQQFHSSRVLFFIQPPTLNFNENLADYKRISDLNKFNIILYRRKRCRNYRNYRNYRLFTKLLQRFSMASFTIDSSTTVMLLLRYIHSSIYRYISSKWNRLRKMSFLTCDSSKKRTLLLESQVKNDMFLESVLFFIGLNCRAGYGFY